MAIFRYEPASAGAQGYSDAIELYDNPLTGSILIDGGAVSTDSTTVTLTLSVTAAVGSGLVSMCLRNNDADCYSCQDYKTTMEWALTSEPGTKKVSVQFRDSAGNISDADPTIAGTQDYSDTIVQGIVLKINPPTGSI
jgi:hypothetical protein